MQVINDISDLRSMRALMPGTFGLVPTMGALHEGHLSLMRRAKAECDYVGVSIFVNPTQFAANEDLAHYPRDLARDLAMLEHLGVDLVWSPAPADVYPRDFQTWVEVEKVSHGLEGGRRPGHFRGVATVVAKLLNVFTPDKAFFGQKDAQQVGVVKRMVEDLNFPVEIVVCGTVRDSDGLALSSRNVYLSPAERRAAPVLYRALSAARMEYGNGVRDATRLCAAMKAELDSEPLAIVDYVSVADPLTLEECDRAGEGALLSLAVRFGHTRLIDNILVGRGEVL
jgi:pantoate--beta-alanine ligase